MEDAEFRSYFREQQVSLQWLPLLRALAAELGSREEPETLRQLFSSIGQRLAGEAVNHLENLSTLAELQGGLNEFWFRMQWGWVRLSEGREQIEIVHHACPLAEAFTDEALGWTCGFLEGYYQAIFAQMGAADQMRVRLVGVSDDGLTLNFELGR